jgi:cell wall-active antibiotic response 4TMS protein YvqF
MHGGGTCPPPLLRALAKLGAVRFRQLRDDPFDIVPPYPMRGVAFARGRPMSAPVSAGPQISPLLIPAEAVPERGGAIGFLSHADRGGDWVLPRLFRVVVFVGRVDLDLTQVRIGPGQSEIEAIAIMGEVRILIPHNLHVECAGDSMLGEFRMKRHVRSVPSPDAPLVLIKGEAVLGAVKIKVVDPNEPGRPGRWMRGRGGRGGRG